MASTIAAQPFNLTISEVCDLNQQPHTSSYQQVIASIAGLDTQTILAGTGSLTKLLSLTTDDASAGSYDKANMRYFSVTNRDDTNYIRLSLSGSTLGYINYKLDAGQKMVFYNTSVSNANSGSSGNPYTGHGAFTYSSWSSVAAVAIGGSVYIQTVFAAV